MKITDPRYEAAVARWIEEKYEHPAHSVTEVEFNYWPGSPGYSEYTPPEPEEYELTYRVPGVLPGVEHETHHRHLQGDLIVQLVTEAGQHLA